MDSYEALMNNPMVSSYQMAHQNSFPQFSDSGGMNNAYGHLNDMQGSFADTSRSAGSGPLGMRNLYPGSQQSGPSSYGALPSSSSSSFSMPYDPPNMQHQQHQQNGGGGGVPPSHSLHMPAQAPMPHASSSSSASQLSTPATTTKTVHSCSYCGLVLSSANALIEHKRIHTGDRPFACHICGKRFTQKAHLNIHKRTHTGEKPYACHICSKRFAQSSHLVSHKRIHTGEKPFVCGICHIGFTQKQRLDAHLKKHLDQGTQEELARIMMAASKENQMRGRPPVRTDDNFMHTMGPGMPYIKQEIGHQEEEDMEHKRPVNGSMFQSPPPDRGQVHPPGTTLNNTDAVKGADSEGENSDSGGDGDDHKNTGTESDKIAAPSFSSEGMFLHPSGYVAYGGIKDNEPSADHSAGGPASEVSSQQGASRRKPSVVRKVPVESSHTDPGDAESSGVVNQFHRFSPLQSGTTGAAASGVASQMEEFHDTGETVDDKSDPPYHSNSSFTPSAPGVTTRRASMPQQDTQHPPSLRNSVSQQAAPTQYPYPGMTNGMDKVGSKETLCYSSPRGSAADLTSGLAKVNTRVSLVNFTAEELLSHLMKRSDVHSCQFCCLIFQDAAMYHIHRNMHDKTDPRRCNMCGQMLTDKYDFTAHFLSMHKN